MLLQWVYHNILHFGLSWGFLSQEGFFSLIFGILEFGLITILLFMAILPAFPTKERWIGLYLSQTPMHNCMFSHVLQLWLEMLYTKLANLPSFTTQIELSLHSTSMNTWSNAMVPPYSIRNLGQTNSYTPFSYLKTKRWTSCL